jgi:hypothetical protein
MPLQEGPALARASVVGTGRAVRRRTHALAGLIGLWVLSACAFGHGEAEAPHPWDVTDVPRRNPAQAEQEAFCTAVAKQDAGDQFDEPTRAHIIASSFRQCMALNTGAFGH